MKKRIKLRKLISLAVALALCLAMAPAPAAAAETAATVQLSQTQGTVSVTNSRGRNLTARADMRLYNGYQVSTQASSYAWLQLDNSKLAKEDAASKVEVRKSGKKLELLVSSGNLYFNVEKPLADDETMNIRTSTMVTGIRGTCGWVESVDSGLSNVYVLEGELECRVTDPVSGQSQTATIHSGEVGHFYVYDRAQNGQRCAVTTERFGEDDVSGFVLTELAGDQALCDKIQSMSGLDVASRTGDAQARLRADEATMGQRLEESAQQIAGQAGKISRTPVWAGGEGESSSTSSDELNQQLAAEGVNEVTLSGNSEGTREVFTVDSQLNVPAGKTLTLGENVDVVVASGGSLQVAGSLHSAGSLSNSGTIEVTSGNTLQVAGQLVNNRGATINNHQNGRIVCGGGILNAGTILNSGSAVISSDGMAVIRMQEGGTLRFTGGEIVNSGGGYAMLREDGLSAQQAGQILSAAGGTFRAKTGNVFGTVDGSGVYTTVNPAGYSAKLQDNGYYEITRGENPSSGSSGSSGSSSVETIYVTTPSTYSLTFDPNGGTMAAGASVPTRTGYLFNGWNTKPDGSGASLTALGRIDMDITVYAQWTADSGGGTEPAPAYTVTFDANGSEEYSGSGETPTRSGYTFLGWNSERDGSGTWLSGTARVGGNVTYYAQWRRTGTGGGTTTEYAFTFDLNTDNDDDVYRIPGSDLPYQDGYSFLGWNTEQDGSGTWLSGMTSVGGDITLYAQWMEQQTTYAGDFEVYGGIYGQDYRYEPGTDGSGGVLKVINNGVFVINNKEGVTTTNDTILVEYPMTVELFLDGVNIDSPTTSPLTIRAGRRDCVTVTLMDGSQNVLKSSAAGCAGLQKNGNGNLTIHGQGELEAYGGPNAAGIGGESITISDGTVIAYGGEGGAGIGGESITISGGTVIAEGGDGGAGIGGGYGSDGTGITINNGDVEATGGNGAAGIGGGNDGNGEHIAISGGNVKAAGGAGGAGIGGGNSGSGEYITISGGDVIESPASVSSRAVSGGSIVVAKGGDGGAGIGGGHYSHGERITISGGNVTATGGGGGAGIGGGYKGNGTNIAISGGYVEAAGHDSDGSSGDDSDNPGDGRFGGAGIGGGYQGSGEDLIISGGHVKAYGGSYRDNTMEDADDPYSPNSISVYGGAGIGGGSGRNGESITISGGDVRAYGGGQGAGIGGGFRSDGSSITINGGRVSADGGPNGGAGIGGGYGGNGTSITISGGRVGAAGGSYQAKLVDGVDDGGSFGGAGIGGGSQGSGTNIIISGGDMGAIGGLNAAGIGGGYQGLGKYIFIIKTEKDLAIYQEGEGAIAVATDSSKEDLRTCIGCGADYTGSPDNDDGLEALNIWFIGTTPWDVLVFEET